MKPKFNDDEIRRAREITRNLSAGPHMSADMRDITGEPRSRASLFFVGLILASALSFAAWFTFSGTARETQTQLPTQTLSANQRPNDIASTPPRSVAPSSPVSTSPTPSSPVAAQATTPKPTALVPQRPRTLPAPSPAMRTPTQEIQPTSESNRQRHQTFAADEAKRYFHYDYKIGSDNLRIHDVFVSPLRTESVSGWPRFRSFGNVNIEYSILCSSQRHTTRRGYEAVTEESNGQVKLIDFTPKWQPLDH